MKSRVSTLRREVEKLEREYANRLAFSETEPWPELKTLAVEMWLLGEDCRPETGYVNSVTGKHYKPHHRAEWDWLVNNDKRNLLARGGEGSGKSSLGAVRALERIKVGASGIAISPTLPHFRMSLWPIFRSWIPWGHVIKDQRYRQSPYWEPTRPFVLSFINGAQVFCGGAAESDPQSLEGSNICWAWFDESRRHRTAAILKVLSGRVRIPVDPYIPSLWLTSTPAWGWMHDFYGEILEDDERRSFKENSLDLILRTADNIENLSEDYVEGRSEVLTSDEIQVYLEGSWLDVENNQPFCNITLWDLCEEKIPPLEGKGQLVLGVDGAVGRTTGHSDCFAICGVSRHPLEHDSVAVRYFRTWRAKPGKKIDFGAEDGPEQEIRRLCRDFGVVCVAYDRFELHDMMMRLNKESLSWFFEFSQQTARLESDKQLLDLIIQRRVAHNGDLELRKHIMNANRRLDRDGRRLRIVKREESLPIDGAVALSMSQSRCLYLNL